MRLRSSYSLGLIFILLVSLIWAASSVLAQYLYSDKFSFDSPFLLTYIGVSLFTVLLPLQWGCDKVGQRNCISSLTSSTNDREVEYESIQTPPTSSHGTQSSDASTSTANSWTTQDHMTAAAKIAPVWFFANYAYSTSLKYTSITSSTVLASTGSLFTFAFALILKDEHFNLYKFVGIVLGIVGSIMTGLHDIGSADSTDDTNRGDDNERLFGDTLGLLSAVGYGGYAVMVRVLCPRDESLMSMQLFLGFVGLFSMLLLSPIAIYQGALQSGMTWVVFGFLVLKGLLDNVLSDYLWARAVVLTSATVATVGLGMTIPLAFASDIVLGRPDVLDLASIMGALAVLAGFVLVNLGQQQEDEEFHVGTDDDPTGESRELQSQGGIDIIDEDREEDRLPMSLEYRAEEPDENGVI